ncbi:acetyl-CoA carboxylase [Saccharopolyspora sp. ASAGF58]|uniref:acetyl-CoA carboxylase n=1 Tax=Saccharopolyspora sp. ASAGF58 TaxID=2719023 RepID=UPI0014402D6E|nr:acetyl-CoA carboxylase [Saccharopolyspora sp. ASAGF58]QIZ37634.1 biotin carboxyl carrier domain-containing protein [Saccharopolyspora sp. ASAGF58]
MPTIKAPMPGVFYRRPSPDADAYVAEGNSIAPGQTIALIEVMKTFNEVKADEQGTFSRFLVEDGDEVSIGDDIAEVESA